jgi:hypothetical protein
MNKVLKEELEATLNFLNRTTTSIAKPTPHVILISNSKEEMEIKLEPVVEEQLRSVFASRHVEGGNCNNLLLRNNHNQFLHQDL